MAYVHDLLDGWKTKRDRRSMWEQHWQDIADYCEPRSSFTRSEVPGGQRTEKIFDTTAMQAKRGLVASLDGLIKPRSQKWLMVKPVDPDVAADEEVKRWVDDCSDRMWDAIYDSRARFIQASGEVDNDLVTFGTGCLFIGENRSLDGFAFRAFDLANTYLGLNSDGIVDQVDLVLRLTAKRAKERFGDSIGEKTREALQGSSSDKKVFEFVQRIFPREERDPRSATSENLAFASITIDVESEHVIGESGYHEFPCAVPRFDTATGEIYGRSPAMLALADIKTNNQQAKTILRAGHLAADPPQIAVWDKAISSQHRIPGGVIYASAKAWEISHGRPPMQPIQNGFNLPIGREMQNDTRDQIWNAFFRNLLQMPVDTKMTATEVIQRKEEFIRVIGPVFGRLEADYTAPTADRVFWVMSRAGAFRPMPRALADRGGIRFDFRNPVTEARKEVEAMTGAKFAELLAPYAQDPEVFGILDMPEMARGVADGIKMPSKWLKSRARFEQEQAVQAQAAQSAQDQAGMMEGGKAVAEMLNKLPEDVRANLGENNLNEPPPADATSNLF